jgi:predicted dehydrogenase/nucleoside-diphosphate-sugar epimerase
MMQDSKPRLRVGIVGAGYVSKHHIRALRTLEWVEIAGVADVNVDAARAVAADFGIPTAVDSLAKLLPLGLDAVYVLTPPATHHMLAIEALEAGCHVLVEKPLAESVADCDAMIAMARARGRVLAVNHSDRLDPIVLAALDEVRAGACGELIGVDFYRGSDYAPYAGGTRTGVYRKGSYPFQDIGVHGLYLLEAFLGRIEALDIDYRSVLHDPNFLFDDWQAVARCERGFGRLHLSWAARPMQNRLIIQGTRGTIEVDRFLQTLTVNRALPGPKFIGMVLNGILGSLRRAFSVCATVTRFALKKLPPSPGIYAGAIDFARAVADGRAPATSAEEGRRIVALMESVSRRADGEAAHVFAQRLKELPPADVLVTGAGGFLGGALLRRLVAEGKAVRVLVRRPIGWVADLPHVQTVIGDLGDPEIVDHAIAGTRVVYHVGAAMRGAPEQFRAGTTVAVGNVIESCLRHGTERLIYVSSLSVMDHAGRPRKRVLREDSPYEPHPSRRGLYTQSKLEAERAVIEAIERRGLRAVIIRPGQIFGPGAERVPPNGVIALAGRWFLVGSGALPLPLVYVDDVVDALAQAGERAGAIGKIFNVVDTTPISQNEYLEACRAKVGIGVKRVPRWVMLGVAAGVEVLGKLLRRDVPLSRYKIRSLRPLANFDVSAAKTALGWQPRVGARAGLERTFGSTETREPARPLAPATD